MPPPPPRKNIPPSPPAKIYSWTSILCQNSLTRELKMIFTLEVIHRWSCFGNTGCFEYYTYIKCVDGFKDGSCLRF